MRFGCHIRKVGGERRREGVTDGISVFFGGIVLINLDGILVSIGVLAEMRVLLA